MSLTSTASAATGPADFMTAPLSHLIHHIVGTHHVYLKSELPLLERLATQTISENGALASLRDVFLELKAELESHLWKEEVVLFPLILTLEEAERAGSPPPPAHCGSVNNPIRVMNMEHAGANEALERMRRLTGDYSLPEKAGDPQKQLYAALLRLEADLHRHIYLEDDILFPRAARLEADLLR